MPREGLIAVIDDDDSFRMSVVEFLDSLGYDAHGFASGEQFVTASTDRSYDCIISDVNMPGMSGIDLKNLLTARNVIAPVVLITGRYVPGLEERARKSGAVCLLEKPFETMALIRYLRIAMNSTGRAPPSQAK